MTTYGRCSCGTLVRVSPMTYTHGETGEPMRLASCPTCHVIVAEGHGLVILKDWQSLAS